MATDDEQLRILSIFHYVVAGVAGLFSLLPVFHITMGFLMLSGRLSSPNDAPLDRLFGLAFIAMGAAFVLAGLAYAVCMGFAGRYLSERRRYLFCLVMAAISCAFVPFGTVLGVFTIIVLQKDSVRQLFPKT
jgi:uncharacterized membrane protein YuzA (DUF378 family)